MLKRIIIIGVIFVCFFTSEIAFSEGQSAKITDITQFNQRLDNYQFKKTSTELNAIVNYLSESDLLINDKNAKAPIRGFFIGIKHDNPAAFQALLKKNLSKSIKSTILAANEFSTDMELFLSNKIDYSPESAAFLDMMWGYFYATGDVRVLNKMCQVQKENPDTVIKVVAKWSYQSNMKKFPSKIKPCE